MVLPGCINEAHLHIGSDRRAAAPWRCKHTFAMPSCQRGCRRADQQLPPARAGAGCTGPRTRTFTRGRWRGARSQSGGWASVRPSAGRGCASTPATSTPRARGSGAGESAGLILGVLVGRARSAAPNSRCPQAAPFLSADPLGGGRFASKSHARHTKRQKYEQGSDAKRHPSIDTEVVHRVGACFDRVRPHLPLPKPRRICEGVFHRLATGIVHQLMCRLCHGDGLDLRGTEDSRHH